MVAQRFSAGKSAKGQTKPQEGPPIHRRCRGMRVPAIALRATLTLPPASWFML